MKFTQDFADKLNELVDEDGRSARKLAEKIQQHFPHQQTVSPSTLSRWLREGVRKPRQWQYIFHIGVILGLDRQQVEELLQLSHHPSFATLRQQVKGADKQLLAHWAQFKPFQAPPDLYYFTGRDNELGELVKIFTHSQQGTICALQGLGGIGKTALAVHVAHQLFDYFPDGVVWVQFGHRYNEMALLEELAEAYGYDVSRFQTVTARTKQIKQLLTTKQALIILDNVTCEDEIRMLLPPLSFQRQRSAHATFVHCSFLITTRYHDLTVLDEYGAHRIIMNPLNRHKGEGVTLLKKILSDEHILPQQEKRLTEIADLLGHLPLALDIAANRIKHEPYWTIDEFLEQIGALQDRVSALKRGGKSVRLSFEMSYRALSLELKQFFTMLGLFEGKDFSVEAVAAIATMPINKSTNFLRQLYNLSLVQAGQNGRYHLHPLLRDFSREQNSLPQKTKERFFDYFTNYILTYQRDYLALAQEVGNLLVTLSHLFTNGNTEQYIECTLALFSFFKTRALYDEAHLHLNQAHQLAVEYENHVHLVEILGNLGVIASRQGSNKRAKQFYEEAIELARAQQNLALLSNLLTKQGVLAFRRGHFTEAENCYTEALTIATTQNNHRRSIISQINLGVLMAKQGHCESAKSYYCQALDATAKINGFEREKMSVLQNLGDLMLDQGDFYQAKTYLQQGLSLADVYKDIEMKIRLLGNIGKSALALSNYHEALSSFREGYTLAEQHNLAQQISRQQANLGQAYLKLNDYKTAHLHYEKGLQLAKEGEFKSDICVISNWLGICFFQQSKLDQAEMTLRDSLQLSRKINQPREEAIALEWLARIAAKRGNINKACQHGEASVTILDKIHHYRADEVRCWLQTLPRK